MKKKILILGGQGFIGINLIKKLKDNLNFQIFATNHKNIREIENEVTYVKCDLTQKKDIYNLFNNIFPDVVIHAAAVTTGSKDVIEKPYLHVTDNVIMNALIFEACHAFNVKHCLFFSCSVPYKSSEIPQNEKDWKLEDIPNVYFGVANMKVFSEKLCEFYSNLNNCKYTAIRHSNIYGPHDKFELEKCHVLPAMINKIVNAKESIEVWGDGKAQRDLLYIEDLVNFIELCIQNQTEKYELFNCGSGRAFSIKEIISEIQKITNKNFLTLKFNISKPNIPTTVVLNCQKAYEKIKWKPTVSLTEGLQKSIDWYIKNKI